MLVNQGKKYIFALIPCKKSVLRGLNSCRILIFKNLIS